MPLTLQCTLWGVVVWGWAFYPNWVCREPCTSVTTEDSEQGAGAMERARLALGKQSKRRIGKAGKGNGGTGGWGSGLGREGWVLLRLACDGGSDEEEAALAKKKDAKDARSSL